MDMINRLYKLKVSTWFFKIGTCAELVVLAVASVTVRSDEIRVLMLYLIFHV